MILISELVMFVVLPTLYLFFLGYQMICVNLSLLPLSSGLWFGA